MPPVPAEPLLAYAEPGVRTAPPRTLLRVLCRAVWELIRAVTRLVQAVLLVLGYLVLAAAVLIRAVLVATAAVLLLAGRLRWNGRAVRVWAVRSFNRAWLGASRLLRPRRSPIPLATPLLGGDSPAASHEPTPVPAESEPRHERPPPTPSPHRPAFASRRRLR